MGKSDYEIAMLDLAASKCLKEGDLRGTLENFSKALECLPEDEQTEARLTQQHGVCPTAFSTL